MSNESERYTAREGVLTKATDAVMGVSDGPLGSVYQQRAVFLPRGLSGPVNWWSISPFHAIVFGGMARNITRTAEAAGKG